MPSIHNDKGTSTPTSAPSLESLIAALSKLPPLEPSAQALLDRARSILTSGPPLSMNVELADGEELPVALHTLNQGAVWACLLGGGANPDLEDRVLKDNLMRRPRDRETHDKIRNALTPEAKCLWFLCRKFFFTFNVAEKDGECCQGTGYKSYYHHRMYVGRLFMLGTANHTALTRVRMPRALEVYSNRISHIARTPKGMWGWGTSGLQRPDRLTFPACPKVAELEASLPPWEKHGMVTGVSIERCQTFILTPVGTVMAGYNAGWFRGPIEENRHRFHPVAVPSGFVPDHIMHVGPFNAATVILSMGDRQMISGRNDYGQLGLGHDDDMTRFGDLPFRVDRIMISQTSYFSIFPSGRQLLFAGRVRPHIAQSGLLPGFSERDKCITATPLRFPERVKGFFSAFSRMIWVTEGVTHYYEDENRTIVPIEAIAVNGYPLRFCDSTGQWFKAVGESDGVAELVECEVAESWEDIIPVDFDQSPQS
ncbi:Not1 N-terminal domain CCR4-Not complex component [Carpediemonas membranifera]|uniref:Not1 N-terminal domain CCR4-Not complex component n=1 Tax=Carpediemonas membranifera TaxID=201153 RepID=A0A8J6AZV4_9EUKA|nr:Not1 N-terminal domain CCR4-Not complex component [Carpediemonas membranifera]|eukprot:KAG9389942.1 Not1 N-terminal domain CCR4-Not complex component [Carpediemonas membranifera]